MAGWKRGLICFALAACPAMAQAAPAARYSIDATLDLRRSVIAGTETVRLTNTARAAVEKVRFFLYPNTFRRQNPGLNEINYLWHYPSAFDAGWLDVRDVRAGARPLPSAVIDAPTLRASVLEVTLDQPLASGEDVTLALAFTCKIPHKYGPFGHYRRTVTLQGGWYPYLVPADEAGQPVYAAEPAASAFDVRLHLSAPRDAAFNGQVFRHATDVTLQADSARLLSLVIAPAFERTEKRAGQGTVAFYSAKGRERTQQIAGAFADALAGLAESGHAVPPELVVVEAPLRDVMTEPAEHMILVSDRFFLTTKLFDLQNLNRLEAARATATLVFQEAAARHETPARAHWVAEAMGWAFRTEFLRTHFKTLSTLRESAGKMGMFRPFNRMAESPTIPFGDTYVAEVPVRDPLRESIFYFNNRLPSGRLLANKLEGTFGFETLGQLADRYEGAEGDLRAQAERVTGRPLGDFFARWENAYPPDLNYRLANVHLNTPASGRYRSRFVVERQTADRNFVEPVEIRVREAGGRSSGPGQKAATAAGPTGSSASTPAVGGGENGGELLHWDGTGSRKEFDLDTTGKVEQIEIDPRHRTVETADDDNIAPHPMEMVIDRGDVSVSSGGFGVGARIRFHRVRDFRRWLFVNPLFAPPAYGFNSGVMFNFGPTVDGLAFKHPHEVEVSYFFRELRKGFASRESGFVDASGRSAGVLVRYEFDNKKFEEDPMHALNLRAWARVARHELGGDDDFFQSLVAAHVTEAVHPKHKIAASLVFGYSREIGSTTRIPPQMLFDLAGGEADNGTVASGRVIGKQMLASTIEWRHDLMSDTNITLMPLDNRVRRLEGVLAVDAGLVAPRVRDLFDTRLVYGVRYGLRVHYDFLGVRPSDVTVDVGHRLGHGSRQEGFVVTFGILQRF